jgi:hypothetical protein
MAIRQSISIFAAALLFSALAQATAISIDNADNNPHENVTVQVPVGPGSTDTTQSSFPVGVGSPNADPISIPNYQGDTIFLKFHSDYLANVEGINAFSITIVFEDDEEDGGESAQVAFSLPGSNIILADPAFTKFGRDDPDPDTLTFTLDANQIAAALPGISDNNFRVRIMRESGDFMVTGATAQLDVTYTPEPASILLFLPAVGLIGLRRRRA